MRAARQRAHSSRMRASRCHGPTRREIAHFANRVAEGGCATLPAFGPVAGDDVSGPFGDIACHVPHAQLGDVAGMA
jgi:hypothetical protein